VSHRDDSLSGIISYRLATYLPPHIQDSKALERWAGRRRQGPSRPAPQVLALAGSPDAGVAGGPDLPTRRGTPPGAANALSFLLPRQTTVGCCCWAGSVECGRAGRTHRRPFFSPDCKPCCFHPTWHQQRRPRSCFCS